MKTIFYFPALLLSLFFLSAANILAQDIIIKKNKEEIKAKVLEIGLEEIKYKPANDPDGPTISIAKDEVWKIKFEKGSEWLNSPDPYDVSSAVEVRDKSRAIKFEFFSPLFGKIAFGYEQMLKVGMNAEFKLGIIGPSVNNEISRDNPRGVFVKFGPKFLLGSEYVIKGMKYTHQLYGKYFKPEIIFSSFGKDQTVYSYTGIPAPPSQDRYRTTSFGLNLVFGKQSIVGNVMTIDWYIGVGYGTQSSTRKTVNFNGYLPDVESYESYCFSHVYLGPNMPLIYTGGLAIGFLLK